MVSKDVYHKIFDKHFNVNDDILKFCLLFLRLIVEQA